ncbi:MAG: DNA-deoxyinosine glycosylase [Acidiferrobacterales bacterium]
MPDLTRQLNSQAQSPIRGFPPISRDDAEILILGSMPSEESLRAKQYYAHPRNAFWPMMMELLGGSANLDYDDRARLLIENRIALWDTLKSCSRNGSLDSAIVDASIETNDFNTFFQKHKQIKHIFFNGQKSRQVYSKYVLPGLPEIYKKIEFSVLPSSSPAMARLDRKQKTDAWRVIPRLLETKIPDN